MHKELLLIGLPLDDTSIAEEEEIVDSHWTLKAVLIGIEMVSGLTFNFSKRFFRETFQKVGWWGSTSQYILYMVMVCNF